MSVFIADWRRTTRRGRPALLRAGYAVALLVGLGGVFVHWFGIKHLAPGQLFVTGSDLPIRDLANLAREFTTICFAVQFAAVILITPAFTAGAIAEERQRRTLDDLLITGLTSRAIVLGKVAARWLQMVGVILAGVPVYCLVTVWGGADVPQIAAGFAFAAVLALTATAFGVWCSVEMSTVTGAVFAAYCLTVPTLGYGVFYVALFLGPMLAGQHALDETAVLTFGGVAALLVLMAAFMSLTAARRLRLTERAVVEDDMPLRPIRRLVEPAIPVVLPAEDDPAPPSVRVRRVARPIPVVLPATPERPPIMPGDDDDPLLWRERRFGSVTGKAGFIPPGAVIALGLGPIGFLALALVVGAALSGTNSPAYRAEVQLLMCGPLACWTFAVAMSAACSVVRERERQTLDGLLTLPGGRAALLRAKWLGVFGRDREIGGVAVSSFAVGALLGMLHPVQITLLILCAAAEFCFCITLGLYCSVRAGTTTQACVNTGLLLLAISIVPLLLPRPADLASPLQLWWTLSDAELMLWPYPDRTLITAVICAAVTGIVTYVLWRLTLTQFHREADGGR
jgi:ABC-type Na+ efflux pump permease subunit